MAGMDELKIRLRKLGEDLQKQLPNIAMEVTITAKGLAERNIRKDGFGSMYSENKIPAFLLRGKELNAKGAQFIAAKEKMGEETNWKELRNAQGLPTDHVNLSYTNKMWAAMGPLPPYWEGNKIFCKLGATNAEAVNKMNWNRARYGNFLNRVLGKNEIEALRQIVFDRTAIIFEVNGFKK